jgi:uncharacterized protein (TIGR00255 family)
LTKSDYCFIVYSIMVQSMTGFGSAEREGCRIEIRSINHRFLDIYWRAPSFLNHLEIPFRTIIKEQFSRGKIDIAITISERIASEPDINTDFVKKIYGALRKLQEELAIKGDIDINTVAGLHDMFIGTAQKYDSSAVTDVFKEALADLRTMRLREGESLAAEIERMAGALRGMNEKIKSMSDKVVADITEKFRERLKLLLEGREIDVSRILQEAAIIAAKLDISEEVARIESHIGQFREILSAGGIIGRKLDFILQELNREVNTTASKSADYGLSSLTVEMKTEIEKIREQVQNIQ